MCAFHMMSKDKLGDAFAYKPTYLMTNSVAVLNGMGQRCPGGHRHAVLLDGRAGPCQKYTNLFCEKLIDCIKVQISADREDASWTTIMSLHDDNHDDNDYMFIDDVTGDKLDPSSVAAARADELRDFDQRHVYTPILESDARKLGMKKTIKTRWVDRNKGTVDSPSYRSRLVAKEFATSNRDDVFSPTPNIEAFKMLLAIFATKKMRVGCWASWA